MDEKLEEIKKKKLEQLKNKYMKGEKNMSDDMPNSPIKMSDTDMDQHIQKYETVVVDCWAPWCGPCRMISPIIDELAKEMQGNLVFGRLNVDENQATALKYGIMSIPSLLVFKNGKLIDKLVGAIPKEPLKSKLETY